MPPPAGDSVTARVPRICTGVLAVWVPSVTLRARAPLVAVAVTVRPAEATLPVPSVVAVPVRPAGSQVVRVTSHSDAVRVPLGSQLTPEICRVFPERAAVVTPAFWPVTELMATVAGSR